MEGSKLVRVTTKAVFDMETGEYKTVVIDTATSLWAVIRHATAEEVDARRLIQRQYTLPNLRMNSVFCRAVNAGLNLVVIQYLKAQFIGEKPTGEEVLSGWKQTDGAVDVALEMDRLTTPVPSTEENRKLYPAGKKTVFRAELTEVRPDPQLNGLVLENPTYDDLITACGYGG